MSAQSGDEIKVLSISSHVVCGQVGNGVIVPALARLAITVFALPTVVLSAHPGYGPPAGTDIEPDTFHNMLEQIDSQGWLADCRGVLTGYFRHHDQVRAAAKTITDLKRRNPGVFYLCDPVIGDDHTGLYVPEPVAGAIGDCLLPLADFATPNRFELEWLSGACVNSPAEAAARTLACRRIISTSIPVGSGKLATVLASPQEKIFVETARRTQAPHGTGDLLAGLLLARLVQGIQPRDALIRCVGEIELVLDQSPGDVLNITAALGMTGTAGPLKLQEV